MEGGVGLAIWSSDGGVGHLMGVLGCPFSLIVPLDHSLGFPEEDLPVWLLESVVFPGGTLSPC